MSNEFETYFCEQYKKIEENFRNGKGEYLFDGDDEIPEKKRISERGKKSYNTSIHTYLLPQPFIGDIENAKIIICSLNPGYSDEDCYIEDKKLAEEKGYKYYSEELLKQLNPKAKNKTLFWLTEEKSDEVKNLSGGAKWWQGKLDQNDPSVSLVERIATEFGVKKEEVFKWLSENMAAIELFPYHSKKFSKSLLNKCDSSEMIKTYVHNDLIEKAKQGERLVCFTRSLKDWVVEECKHENIILNSSVQNITFNVELDFGKSILNYIRDNSDKFKTPLKK